LLYLTGNCSGFKNDCGSEDGQVTVIKSFLAIYK
jgi:hypothetical protein